MFHGDTLHVTTEVLSRRETARAPTPASSSSCTRRFNQQGELVAECRRQAMMRKRPKA